MKGERGSENKESKECVSLGVAYKARQVALLLR